LEDLINSLANVNDIVVDLTIAEAIGVACKKIQIETFIGIEKDENYSQHRYQRIMANIIVTTNNIINK
jgi:hypothetical protein